MVRFTFNANESFEQLQDRWALEIGRFVMAFGNIEANTYVALRHFPHDPIGAALIEANLSLRPRLEVLIEVAKGRQNQPWLALVEVLERIKKLAWKRNLIAHNGVGFDVYVDATGDYYVEQAISNSKKRQFARPKTSDSVLFEELVQHREEAEKLSRLLGTSVVEILKELGIDEGSRP